MGILNLVTPPQRAGMVACEQVFNVIINFVRMLAGA